VDCAVKNQVLTFKTWFARQSDEGRYWHDKNSRYCRTQVM